MASAPGASVSGRISVKLLAADAGDHVELTLVLVQDAGRALERGVADVVAPAVVDLLEVVDVPDQHVGAPSHRADEDRCDDESAHAHHPPRGGAGGQRRHREQGGVDGAHVSWPPPAPTHAGA
jgi:hypothetical protein